MTSTPPNTNEFEAEAVRLLGKNGFTSDPDLVTPWLTDWRGRFTGKALGIASPASTSEVADFVRLCLKHAVPIVPQGGNSGMVAGATPGKDGGEVLLSLRRMSTIDPVDPSKGYVQCDAGVILQNLHDIAIEHDLRFPLTLGGKGSATVGGLISTNAGGTQVLRHGTMRAQTLGLEAVLADGSVLDVLTPYKKDNRGFDLKQLLIGSEGTLGIITRATLQLLPEIGGRTVIWAGLKTIQAARQLLLHFERHSADHLEGFEVIPQHSLDAVLDHLPSARAPLGEKHGWHALIELVASKGGEEELAAKAEMILQSALEAGLIEDATIAANESQADAFWLIRDSIAPAEKALGPAVQHDVSVPVEHMADFVDAAIPAVEQEFPACKAICFGHLGDGNVHFHVIAPKLCDVGDEADDWVAGEGKAISSFVYDLVTRWNGSISAEHGIGQAKIGELSRLSDPVRLATMQAVKQALDPQGLLNPGKLVPLAPKAVTP